MKVLMIMFCAAGLILTSPARADEPAPRPMPPQERGDRYTEAANSTCSCDRPFTRASNNESGLLLTLLLSVVIGNNQQPMMGGPQMMMGGQQQIFGRNPFQSAYGSGGGGYSSYGATPNFFQSGYSGAIGGQQMSVPTYLPYLGSTQSSGYGLGTGYTLGGGYAGAQYGSSLFQSGGRSNAPMMLPYRQ